MRVVDPNSSEAAARRAALRGPSPSSEEAVRRKAVLVQWGWAILSAATATTLLALFVPSLAAGYLTAIVGALAVPIVWRLLAKRESGALLGDPVASVALSSALFVVLAATRPETAERLGGMLAGTIVAVLVVLAVASRLSRRTNRDA